MQKLKVLFTIACMLATSVVTIATSKKSDQDPLQAAKTQEVYLVASSCPGALPYDTVTIQNKEIVSPQNRHASEFGLPSSLLSFRDEDVLSGWIGEKMRTCRHALIDHDQTKLNVYTCSEDGVEVCKVSFELDAVLNAF